MTRLFTSSSPMLLLMAFSFQRHFILTAKKGEYIAQHCSSHQAIYGSACLSAVTQPKRRMTPKVASQASAVASEATASQNMQQHLVQYLISVQASAHCEDMTIPTSFLPFRNFPRKQQNMKVVQHLKQDQEYVIKKSKACMHVPLCNLSNGFAYCASLSLCVHDRSEPC